MTEFNGLDYIVLAIFFFAMLLGFIRGFVSELISIVAVIAAFIVATALADSLSVTIMGYKAIQLIVMKTSSVLGGDTSTAITYVALAVSYIILFALVLVLGMVVKFFLNMALGAGLLGIGNRILGGAFGFGKGFILSLVFLFIVKLTPLSNENWWQQSYFVNIYGPSIAWLDSKVEPAIEQLKERLQNSNLDSKLQELLKNPGNFNR